MPAANEKKCTQKTSTESINDNGGITVDEVNAIQDNIRKNLEFFKKKLDLSDDKELACKLGVTPPVYSRIKKGAISGLKQTVLRSKTDAMRSERT